MTKRMLFRGVTVMQWGDEWFDELQDRWRPIPPEACGQWDDHCFPPHVYIRGSWTRFSDAVHPSLFEGKYGRPKPLPQEQYNEI